MKTVRDYSSEKKRYAAPFYEVVKFDFSQTLLDGSPHDIPSQDDNSLNVTWDD